MSGIDWDKEFTRMNPETDQEKEPAAPSKFAARLGGVRRNTAALAVCGTLAVVAVCGTVVTVTHMQGQQAAQDRARDQEAAANALVEAEAGKKQAQTQESAAKALYEREMTVYRECMKGRAAALAKANSYEVSRIAECDPPVLGEGQTQAHSSSSGGAGSLTSSPWLWVALVAGGGLVAYKKLSPQSGSTSGSVATVNDSKGFTFEKGA